MRGPPKRTRTITPTATLLGVLHPAIAQVLCSRSGLPCWLDNQSFARYACCATATRRALRGSAIAVSPRRFLCEENPLPFLGVLKWEHAKSLCATEADDDQVLAPPYWRLESAAVNPGPNLHRHLRQHPLRHVEFTTVLTSKMFECLPFVPQLERISFLGKASLLAIMSTLACNLSGTQRHQLKAVHLEQLRYLSDDATEAVNIASAMHIIDALSNSPDNEARVVFPSLRELYFEPTLQQPKPLAPWALDALAPLIALPELQVLHLGSDYLGSRGMHQQPVVWPTRLRFETLTTLELHDGIDWWSGNDMAPAMNWGHLRRLVLKWPVLNKDREAAAQLKATQQFERIAPLAVGLTELDLSDAALAPETLASLAASIRALTMSNCTLSDGYSTTELPFFPRLETLRMTACGRVVLDLTDFTTLTHLELRDVTRVTAATLRLPSASLQVCRLESFTGRPHAHVELFEGTFPALRVLEVKAWPQRLVLRLRDVPRLEKLRQGPLLDVIDAPGDPTLATRLNHFVYFGEDVPRASALLARAPGLTHLSLISPTMPRVPQPLRLPPLPALTYLCCDQVGLANFAAAVADAAPWRALVELSLDARPMLSQVPLESEGLSQVVTWLNSRCPSLTRLTLYLGHGTATNLKTFCAMLALPELDTLTLARKFQDSHPLLNTGYFPRCPRLRHLQNEDFEQQD